MEGSNLKYAVLEGNEKFQIRQGDLKVNGTPIIKVTHVGVCGTDMSYWKNGEQYKGQVIGHEYSGIIVDPGRNLHLKAGDRVVGYTQNVYDEFCGICENCLSGDFDNCSNRKVKTWKGGELNHPGCYSELTTWFPRSMCKLPESVSNEEAALIEPMTVCLHAVTITDIRPNDKVLILGGGIIGLGVAEWARSFGAGLIAITEIIDEKIKAIEGFGCADHVLKGDEQHLHEQLMNISNGGFDVIFDCAGAASAIKTGIAALKPEIRARKQLTAIALSNRVLELDYDDIVLREIVIRGSKGHTFDEFQAVIKHIATGRMNVRKYITKRLKFSQLQEGFEELKKSGGTAGKAIIEMEK